MSNRRRTYSGTSGGNNIGVEADFIIRISKTESDPASMITVDGDPEPLLKAFRRCLAKSTEDNKINICYLDDSNSNYYENGEAAVLTGAEGDVMVYFPEFWYKGTDTDSEWVFNITTTQVDKDSYQDLGWHYAPASLVGVYKGYDYNDMLYSRSGVERTTNVSMDYFSIYARNRGAGYHLIDYQQHCIITWMFYARYKNTNSQAICGTGNDSYEGISNGTTNTLGITDTTPSNAGSSSQKLVNFLGIEGCWGYIYEWIEGIHSHSSDGIMAYDKGDFHDLSYNNVTSSTKRVLRNLSEWYDSGYITEIEGGEYMDMVGAEYSGSSVTYFCDYGYAYPNNSCVFARSNSSGSPSGGVAYLAGYYNSNNRVSNYGSRLAFDGEITIIEDVNTFKSISGTR